MSAEARLRAKADATKQSNFLFSRRKKAGLLRVAHNDVEGACPLHFCGGKCEIVINRSPASTGALTERRYIPEHSSASLASSAEWRMVMVPDGIAPSGDLWFSIRREAEAALARDPIFGRTLSASILDHPDLGAAVAHQIGERLGKSAADRQLLARVAREVFEASPDLIDAASRDLQCIAVHDPATTGWLPPLLNFKGYVALQAWRVSNRLWRQGRTDLALLMQSLSSDSLQVSIHPSASIGTSVFLDHATGIIVGALVVIGDNTTILQNVTIGRKPDNPDRAPRIGRGVLLSAGATILGDVHIGDSARIGAGAVVTSDVPGGCTAVGDPARLTNCLEEVS